MITLQNSAKQKALRGPRVLLPAGLAGAAVFPPMNVIDEGLRALVRAEVKSELAGVKESIEKLSRARRDDELLPLEVAGQRFAISQSTLKRMVREGTIQRYGSGRIFRVKPSEILAALTESRGEGPVDATEKARRMLRGGR